MNMKRFLKIGLVGITVGSLCTGTLSAATSSPTPTSDMATIHCDKLNADLTGASAQLAAGLCHRIKSDAYQQGMSLTKFSQTLKENHTLAIVYQDQYALYSQEGYDFNNAANRSGLAATMSATSSNTAMCQGLCAGADAAMAIPIIGWIISAGLIAAAIAKGCDNCGGFTPV